MNNENQVLDAFMGIKAEKEYYITEWTSDHARIGWWKESSIMEEHGISHSSKNKDDWHCSIQEERIFANKYHRDWNLLMDVLQRIEYTVPLGYLQNNPYYRMIRKEIPDLLKTHQAIVDFIKDYASKDPTILAA